MRVIVGIPARYASTRFPGKPLAALAGRPMLAHVIERAMAAMLGSVLVATDDQRIAEVAVAAGAEVRMTRSDHASGTERLAEATADLDCDVVVNVQGDEPLIEPEAIRAVIRPLAEEPELAMATLAHPIESIKELHDPNIVKVVVNCRGHAMYFSRAPIPYPRCGAGDALKHVGLYAYRKDFLMAYPALVPCDSEKTEHLEQLRVLHHGHAIAVSVGDFIGVGVDTPEDLRRAEALLARGTLQGTA